MKQWYEKFFENYAESYGKESFTQGTIGEVDFIEQEINYNKKLKILDVGCGTGRHAVELAKRGYQITGIDLSEAQLRKAWDKADQQNVKVKFIKKDARNFEFPGEYEIVIMICEGAFSLMETDEMNYQILKNIVNSLKPGGKLIFTTLNALFPLYHSVKDFINENANKGTSDKNTFDLMTFRDISTFEVQDDDGNLITLNCNERYYSPSEITWLLKSLNFCKVDIFGCEIGKFTREKKLTTDDYEMLVIAEK